MCFVINHELTYCSLTSTHYCWHRVSTLNNGVGDVPLDAYQPLTAPLLVVHLCCGAGICSVHSAIVVPGTILAFCHVDGDSAFDSTCNIQFGKVKIYVLILSTMI